MSFDYKILSLLFFIPLSLASQYNIYSPDKEHLEIAEEYFSANELSSLYQNSIVNLHHYQPIIATAYVPFLEAFPKLKEQISHVALTHLPTPIIENKELAAKWHAQSFYIKNDGLTNLEGFAGNKLRKLEFILGRAKQSQSKEIVGRGCVGTNYGLALAWYAKKHGLKCHLLLQDQPNSHLVRNNLLLHHAVNAQIIHVHKKELLPALAKIIENGKLTFDKIPFITPTGGSYPLGICGYINALFELDEQVKNGVLRMPHRIYVPTGSTGTLVGLLIGCKLLKLDIKLIGIAIEPEEQTNALLKRIEYLFTKTMVWLRSLDSNIPQLEFNPEDIVLLFNATGTDYGSYTNDGIDFGNQFTNATSIPADDTYTKKAIAGMKYHLDTIPAYNERILYWHTFSSNDCSSMRNAINYKDLPSSLHTYFENEVQSLDY